MGSLIALAALAVIAPLVAWLGRRHGRAVRGAGGLAMILLGLGSVVDPPRRHMIEAIGGEENEDAGTGEPKDAAGGS